MIFPPIDIPGALIEAQEAGELAIFVGAGVSRGAPSNLPDFASLAIEIAGTSPLAKRLKEDQSLGRKPRYDQFLGELRRAGVGVEDLCRGIIGRKDSTPTELHSALLKVFGARERVRLVTTNFDDHFAVAARNLGWTLEKYYAPALPLGSSFHGIVHIHGSITRKSDPLVLTDEDFGRAYLTEGWAREFLQRLFTEFTTLFVGYSHDDIPVEYLARGMSIRQLKPRFAITQVCDMQKWASLGVEAIGYQLEESEPRHINLTEGVKNWAKFSTLQPTETAEQVRAILESPPESVPDKAQTDLLLRCLKRPESCQTFTQYAQGWRWVEWCQANGLVEACIVGSQAPCEFSDADVTFWLARELVKHSSDDALLLLDGLQDRVRPQFIRQIGYTLNQCSRDGATPSRFVNWVVLCLNLHPRPVPSSVTFWLSRLPKDQRSRVAMLAVRKFTDIRLLFKREYDITNGGQCAEPEAEMSGDYDQIHSIWTTILLPDLCAIRPPLLDLIEGRFREAHEQLAALGYADDCRDPWCYRGLCGSHGPPDGAELSGLLELYLEVVDASLKDGWFCDEQRILRCLESGVPILVRLGLRMMQYSTIAGEQRIQLLCDRALVYPKAFEGWQESWPILRKEYPELSNEAKLRMWSLVRAGPSHKLLEGGTEDQEVKLRNRAVAELTAYLGLANHQCALATRALEETASLSSRSPDELNQHVILSLEPGSLSQCWVDGGRSSTAVEPLEAPPGRSLERILSLSDPALDANEQRLELLDTVRDEVRQNKDWGLGFTEELVRRRVWAADIWQIVFSGAQVSSWGFERAKPILVHIQENLEQFFAVVDLTRFLFHRVPLAGAGRAPDNVIVLLIDLSLTIWNRIELLNIAPTASFRGRPWMYDAVSDSSGQIVEFWVQLLHTHLARDADVFRDGLGRIRAALGQVIKGDSLPRQFGCAVMAWKLVELYAALPTWTREFFLPKFAFGDKGGEEALLVWEPHARCGRLSRDLTLCLLPTYRAAFDHLDAFDEPVLHGFTTHIAAIACSGFVDPLDDDWLPSFLVRLKPDQLQRWVMKVDFCLKSSSPDMCDRAWKTWVGRFWRMRLAGHPVAVTAGEAAEMIMWVLRFSKAFAAGVRLACRTNAGELKIGNIIFFLMRNSLMHKRPYASLRLLNHALRSRDSNFVVWSDLVSLLDTVPKRPRLWKLVDRICEGMCSRGYQQAPEVKARLRAEFGIGSDGA